MRDDNYDLSNFLGGKYDIGPAADIDKLQSIYQFARNNPIFYNASYHENRMLKYHRTNSLIYDYDGTENYKARYAMIDFNIGSKLNVITGSRVEEIETNSSTALIALTHDPKIDDPALQYALKNNFFYIGALGSKKTHQQRKERLRNSGFKEKQIERIYGPIGLDIGASSPEEIAISILSEVIATLRGVK